MNDLLMAFYGDDFTGSADAMEALTLNGVPTALFLDRPGSALLRERLKNVRAVGVAGTSRAMTPTEMDGELPGQFQLLKDLGRRSSITRSARRSTRLPGSAASAVPPILHSASFNRNSGSLFREFR